MPKREFVSLIEQNMRVLDRLADKLKAETVTVSNYSRQQLTTLVRLHIGGRALLKDIARRELVTAPNLCASFRRLERDGMVLRTIDENDRRNTWYSVTEDGAKVAEQAMDIFRASIERLFNGVNKEDEARLTTALKTINELLKKMENKNAQN